MPPGTKGTTKLAVPSLFRACLLVSMNCILCMYPSFATTVPKQTSMWPRLSCSHMSPVRPRGGETLGTSQIRSLTSMQWKVGMTAIALSSLPCSSVARACTASGKSHAIYALISKELSWMNY